MVQTKILRGANNAALENELNKFLANLPEDRLIDIKFNVSNTAPDSQPYGGTIDIYAAMVIYKAK
ncbi:sporulation protein Cse60 [Sediminibacillus massiliensis]|uniref:sporulation protein Cse60 n=1 Tax=Sediminibacillus massiliensis TaxID=1926277 RepID=UPI0009884013|nr:sporulation protein Cse60 [Sediminibacillus massiliensis]